MKLAIKKINDEATAESAGGVRYENDTGRATVVRSPEVLVENLRCVGVRTTKPPEDYSSAFQVCLPYRGVFVWRVGDADVVGDANQVLFVAGGEAFRVCQPRWEPYSELIITPNPTVLAELVGSSRAVSKQHPLFRRRSRRADPALQRRVAHVVHTNTRQWADTLAGDEVAVDLLRGALHGDDRRPMPSRATRRFTEGAKEFLHAHLTEQVRLSHVAQAIGVSPTYLTDLFGRVEGVPLHRYLTQLRLSRAMIELPDANDLTALALRLGFSSHSHFTATFRRAFGETPSNFRADARRRQ